MKESIEKIYSIRKSGSRTFIWVTPRDIALAKPSTFSPVYSLIISF